MRKSAQEKYFSILKQEQEENPRKSSPFLVLLPLQILFNFINYFSWDQIQIMQHRQCSILFLYLQSLFLQANLIIILLLISQMGAACFKGNQQQHGCNCPQCQKCQRQFLANLRELHKEYVKLVLHVRETRLFADRNQRLLKAVEKYFHNGLKADKEDKDVASVDTVRKLHPKEYWNSQVDQEWMIQACLRQQKFSDETKVEKVSFDHAYPQYLQFLYLCKENMKKKKITVPSKCQDIIWHSHMTDPENYKKDTQAYLGKLLNHMDDIPDDQLKKHAIETKKLEKELQQSQNN